MQIEQEIKYINVKDLVLWTENPRDPISINANDQDIVDLAFEDKDKRWGLSKLANTMGKRYDFSELPTVVYHGKIPVVYDANRRVILGKIKHGLVQVKGQINLDALNFPEEMPCNVCEKRIALENILRKHGDSGSWQPLERDIFLHKHMGYFKSTFLILEEGTGLITAHSWLNKRFVKDEIFNEEKLVDLGFYTATGKLKTNHSNEQATDILADISEKILNKEITTRQKRGQVTDILSDLSKKSIKENKNKNAHDLSVDFKSKVDGEVKQRQSARQSKTEKELFGGRLYLEKGSANDLYKDIVDLNEYYLRNKARLSSSFPILIRMSLRLLADTAAEQFKTGTKFNNFVESNFNEAKKLLDHNNQTFLSTHSVNQSNIVKLLNTGAHHYDSSKSFDQTLAISIILGAILKIKWGIK